MTAAPAYLGAHLLTLSCARQIENEYGFCNFNDKVYLRHLAASARKAFGADAVLFTTDPPQVTAIGSLYGDEVLTCAQQHSGPPLRDGMRAAMMVQMC